MTLFQLSYSFIWALAIVLIPISALLLYLQANLKVQVKYVTDSGALGHALVGRSLGALTGTQVPTGKTGVLESFLGQKNVVLALSPHCGSCNSWLSQLSSDSIRKLNDIVFVVLCMGQQQLCEQIGYLMDVRVRSSHRYLERSNSSCKEIKLIERQDIERQEMCSCGD
jgi:hypothetical protein